MVWAAVSSEGKTEICFTNQNLNSNSYQNILQNYLLPHLQDSDYFIQDNAPIHVSKSTNAWLHRNKVKQIQWPSRSPDLNIIENIWGHLTRQLYGDNQCYNTIDELKELLRVNGNFCLVN